MTTAQQKKSAREKQRRFRLTPKGKANAKKTRARWKARHPDANRDMILKREYGITVTDFDRMLVEQNGVCAICRRPERLIEGRKIVGHGKPRRLSVDHCHASQRVRGLLCASCNNGLGRFDDSPALLRAAADYLERQR